MNQFSTLQAKATDFIVVKWSCCSALCFNNHRTTDTSGNWMNWNFTVCPEALNCRGNTREFCRRLVLTGTRPTSVHSTGVKVSEKISKIYQMFLHTSLKLQGYESSQKRPGGEITQVWQKCWAGKLSLPHDFHWSHLPFKGKLRLIVVQLLWLQLLAVALPLEKQDDPVTGSLLLSWKIWSWNTWKPWKSWKMLTRK